MPPPRGIDPNRHFTDINPEIKSQFRQKGMHANLRLSKANRLYVARGFFHRSPEDTIRHEKIFKKERDKMIAAGCEIEDKLKGAIDREFPKLRVKGQTIGDYAMSRAQARKLDSWAFRERERIEALAEDPLIDDEDIDVPYQLNRAHRDFLLSRAESAAENEDLQEKKEDLRKRKERLLKNTLTDEQRATLTSEFDGADMDCINRRVIEGLRVSAQVGRDADMRNLARDHLAILKAREYFPQDVVAHERHTQRHRIVEQNRLLRRAIADDLRSHPYHESNADAAADCIVSNLQTSSNTLSPANLMKAADLLKSLGCRSDHLEELADLAGVEQALNGTIPDSLYLNASIERSASSPEFQAEGANIKNAIAFSEAALQAAADCVNKFQLADEKIRNKAAAQLIESAALFADLCNRPPFSDAADGSPTKRLAEKMARQALIANELGQALKEPSLHGDLPSLKKAPIPEIRSPVDLALLSSSKRQVSSRLLEQAIIDDVTLHRNFNGDAKALAANIVYQLPAGRSMLTRRNIAAVRGILESLRLPHDCVDRLVEHIEVEEKLSASIPQIRKLNKASVLAIDSLRGDKQIRNALINQAGVSLMTPNKRALRRLSYFFKYERIDSQEDRKSCYHALKAYFIQCADFLKIMELKRRNAGANATESYSVACRAVEAEMAAICDLAQALHPSNDNRAVSRSIEKFYQQSKRSSARLHNIDATILNQHLETPRTLFCSDAHRWRSHELLADPLRSYNKLLDHISTTFNSYKNSGSKVKTKEFREALAMALSVNDQLLRIFQSVNKLRDVGNNGRNNTEMNVLKKQRECLQALQAGVLRAMSAQGKRNELLSPPLSTIVEVDDEKSDWDDDGYSAQKLDAAETNAKSVDGVIEKREMEAPLGGGDVA
ncbi:MAG: hypothetical protein AAF936_08640 [Pseudomonadota bacterium]